MPVGFQDPSRSEEGIFPSFFMTGFECSTFIWKDRQRKDYITLTGHSRHLNEDYRWLKELGIGAAREGTGRSWLYSPGSLQGNRLRRLFQRAIVPEGQDVR